MSPFLPKSRSLSCQSPPPSEELLFKKAVAMKSTVCSVKSVSPPDVQRKAKLLLLQGHVQGERCSDLPPSVMARTC